MGESQQNSVIYNFVTGEFELLENVKNKEDLADYLPQNVESLSLYDAYVAQGFAPIDAALHTYKVLIGKKLTTVATEEQENTENE